MSSHPSDSRDAHSVSRPAEGVRARAELRAADDGSENSEDADSTDSNSPPTARVPTTPIAATPVTDHGGHIEPPSRGVLFDGSFRERLLHTRATGTSKPVDGPSASHAEQVHNDGSSEPDSSNVPDTLARSSRPSEDTSGDALVESLPNQREGLPRGFRMRHSHHYVDEIATPQPGTPLRQIEIQRILYRDPLPKEGLSALIESIRELGLVQPLIVRPVENGYELVAGSTRLAAASAAGLQAVPCVIQNVNDEQARALTLAARVKSQPPVSVEANPLAEAPHAAPIPARALDEVERSLRAIISSVEMMRSAPGPLLERAGRDLMTAEAHRCDWMVRATRFVGEVRPPKPRLHDITPTLERLGLLLEPENRLLSIDHRLEFGRGTPRVLQVLADEDILALGFEATYRFLLATLAESRGGTMLTHCELSGDQIHIRLSQDQVPLSQEVADSLFNLDSADRPGGFLSAVGLTCARQALEVHRGTFRLVRGEVSGGDHGSGFGFLASVPLPA